MTKNAAEIAAALRKAERIAVVSHVNPDGDTIGTALAMKLGLEQMEKTVALFDQDKVPDMLYILPGSQEFRTPDTLSEDEHFDLLLVVDVADEKRMGDCAALKAHCDHSAQIDHHGTNPFYCEVNAVDPDAPATGQIAREVLSLLGIALDREIAMCLYAAISTDTGNFAYNSTNAETFALMSELMDAGLPLGEMNRHLFRERDPAQVLLMQRALATMRFEEGGRITSMVLTMRDFEECGALPEHADTIVNYGIEIRGVCMTALARETDRGIKLSLRAMEPYQVSEIARHFGGGGHALASGCTMQGTLEDCRNQVVEQMKRALKEME